MAAKGPRLRRGAARGITARSSFAHSLVVTNQTGSSPPPTTRPWSWPDAPAPRSLVLMTQNSLTPAGNASLVKGAAIAALVYRGLAFLAFGFFASSLTSLFFPLASLVPTGTSDSPSELSAAPAVLLIFLLTALGAPVALSLWMLAAANRGRSGQVLAALILYSIPLGLSLIEGIVVVVSYDHDPALSGPSLNPVIGILPEAAIIIVGWVGWWQMRRPPAAPAIDQPPYQVQQPIPYTAPPQQYAPPYQGPPQTPQPPPQPGQSSPWQRPGQRG